jgi:hypothetical protein
MLRRLGLADGPGKSHPSLQACLETVLEQSGPVMDDILGGLKATLVPVMGKPAPATVNTVARKTITALCEQAPALRRSFSSHLRQQVFGGDTGVHSAQQLVRFDDFQFLDAQQIDASIEFAQSQQTVMMAVEDVLPTLNAMVSHLMGWSSVQAHLNPLKPDAFVQALRAALEEQVADRAARATVMGLCAGLLGVSLKGLYREIADWLRSQGVEPVHMAPSASTGMWNPANAKESTVARTMLTLNRLRSLLSGELEPEPVVNARIDFSHTIPSSMEALQDLKLVEPMMKRLAERASQALAGARAVPGAGSAQQGDAASRKAMGLQLGREVVLLMLDKLLQDRRLLAPVRVSLKALEPALLKLVQQDGRFFSERQHPARVFLDRLTHRSLAFASEGAPGYAVFQKNIDNAVRVLVDGAGEASAFARIVRKLDDAWAREDAAQHQRAADAARGLLRAEQRNVLARRHGRQFVGSLQGLQVPAWVLAFLRGPWAQVVAEAQLNFADGSEDPGGYLALVDDLVWSAQPRLTRYNQARLLQLLPDLLVSMRRGLGLISYPPERMAEFFDALTASHEQEFDDTPSPQQPEGHVGQETEAADSFWIVQTEAQESGYLDAAVLPQVPATDAGPQAGRSDRRFWRVESLATGAWVDLVVGGKWLRAQLTWASPQRSLFLFIAGEGSAHSMSRQTLDKMKQAGLVRMVSANRVLDNALDAVAQTALRNDLRAPPIEGTV